MAGCEPGPSGVGPTVPQPQLPYLSSSIKNAYFCLLVAHRMLAKSSVDLSVPTIRQPRVRGFEGPAFFKIKKSRIGNNDSIIYYLFVNEFKNVHARKIVKNKRKRGGFWPIKILATMRTRVRFLIMCNLDPMS